MNVLMERPQRKLANTQRCIGSQLPMFSYQFVNAKFYIIFYMSLLNILSIQNPRGNPSTLSSKANFSPFVK